MSFSEYHIEKGELKKFHPSLFVSETIKVKEDRGFRSHALLTKNLWQTCKWRVARGDSFSRGLDRKLSGHDNVSD